MARASAAVYRRRRLVVLLGLLLVIALIATGVWALIVRPWEGGDPTADETRTPVVQESDSPEPTESAGDETTSPTPQASETPAITVCAPGVIAVEAITDQETYAAGELPKLSISLTNTGAVDCTMNVGTSTQQFVVTSGADTWWRSTDCQESPSDQIATIKAGQTVTSAEPVVWDRTRSQVETCDAENRQRAPGGGASYHVAVSIGGFDSMSTRQIFLR